jgi:sec-independent protein translocase protein TatA
MAPLATIGLFEALLIAFVIVVLFFSAKIPQLMRGLGAGLHEFKKGIKEGEGDAAKPADTQ